VAATHPDEPLIDAEPDGQPMLAADGDDAAASDDEYGVTFTSLLFPGDTATIDVVASAPAKLDAWIDFNADGSWAEAGDQTGVGIAGAKWLRKV
jgi:hypothetical protein